MKRQECPVFGARVEPSYRYPEHLCKAWIRRAVSAQGRPLAFSNVDFSGGHAATYRDTGERYPSRDCYVDGIACEANEARFGGIVVQRNSVPILADGDDLVRRLMDAPRGGFRALLDESARSTGLGATAVRLSG